MSSVELRSVTKTFEGGRTAVHDLDLAIGDGELVVLVGPPGAGKSTVLRMLAGLEAPSSGDIRIDGVPLAELTPRRRDIALAAPNALHPHLTVAQNLGLPLRVQRVRSRRVKAKVREVAALLNIADLLDCRLPQLSREQLTYVALGRWVIREPRLCLMDDLMASVESKPRAELRTAVMRIQRQLGTTMVVATDDPVEAMAIADRVAVMVDGHVIQRGTPSEIYQRPADIVVAQFMGSPPMNIVRGTIVASASGVAVRLGDQLVAIGSRGHTDRSALAGMQGRDIAVGIRPEAVQRDAGGAFIAGMVSADLDWPHQVLHAQIAAPRVTATDQGVTTAPGRSSLISLRVKGHHDVSRWEPLNLHLDPGALHLFDLETGLPLLSMT